MLRDDALLELSGTGTARCSIGAVCHFLYVVDPRGSRAAFGAYLAMESASWRGEKGGGSALVLDPRLKSFYQHVMRGYAQRRGCDIHLLRLAGKAIAGQLTIKSNRTVYILKIAYDENYANLSPGILMLDYLFRFHADQQSIDRIDFTTDMIWMKDWQPTREEISDVFLFQSTFRGQVARLLVAGAKNPISPADMGCTTLPAACGDPYTALSPPLADRT